MIEYCWEESFLDDKVALTLDGKEIGFVEPYGASWRVVYGMETIAVRPDKSSAQNSLTRYHQKRTKARA